METVPTGRLQTWRGTIKTTITKAGLVSGEGRVRPP